MANKKYYREQTGREVAKTFALMFVAICFVLYGDETPIQYETRTLCINAIGLLIGGIALLYQNHCMHTPLKGDKKEERRDGE